MSVLAKGVDYWKEGQLSEAETFFRTHLEQFPEDVDAWANLANIYRDRGEPHLANQYYSKALEIEPDSLWIRSNQLMTLHYDSHVQIDQLADAHRAFSQPISERSAVQFKNELNENKRIHLGFLSADFRWHSVSFFLFGLLREIDTSKFEITCFSSNQNDDSMTDLLRENTHGWVDCSGYSDEKLGKIIRRSRIDIVIDLSGHTAYNRAGVLEKRCGPIQISWLGYPSQTGVSSIDYWLTDSIVSEYALFDQQEKPLVLPEGSHAYFPPLHESEIITKTDRSEKPFVFGCFNHRAKMNEETFLAWAKILESVKDSQLLLKGKVFRDETEIRKIQDLFEKKGISKDLIIIKERADTTRQHLETYRLIDVALDTFPYNGTTTTCEALWMGVPVITKKGNTPASNVSASLLNQMGKTEWICSDWESYISAAIELSKSQERLNDFRRSSREIMKNSGLTDHSRFARSFEDKMRQVWSRYCKLSSSGK